MTSSAPFGRPAGSPRTAARKGTGQVRYLITSPYRGWYQHPWDSAGTERRNGEGSKGTRARKPAPPVRATHTLRHLYAPRTHCARAHNAQHDTHLHLEGLPRDPLLQMSRTFLPSFLPLFLSPFALVHHLDLEGLPRVGRDRLVVRQAVQHLHTPKDETLINSLETRTMKRPSSNSV